MAWERVRLGLGCVRLGLGVWLLHVERVSVNRLRHFSFPLSFLLVVLGFSRSLAVVCLSSY